MNKNSKVINFIKEWGTPLISAVVIYLIITRLVFFNINVPTGSMKPTIEPGDRILVTRIHNLDNLKSGDIVVFHSDEFNENMIKRLIGLPNDVIEIKKDGTVYRNNEEIKEPYVKYQVKDNEIYFGLHVGKYVVPEGHYLFLGDNRNNSKDSRYWENPYIAKGDIMGKGRITFFPFNRFGKLK